MGAAVIPAVWTVVGAGLAGLSAACLVGLTRSGGSRLDGLGLAQTRRGRVGVGPFGSVPSARSHDRLLPAAGFALGVFLVLGPVAALLAVLGAVLGERTRQGRRSGATRREERRRAVEACAALAGELRAGRTPAAALGAAAEIATGPSQQALRSAAAAAQLGGDVSSALAVASSSASATAVPELLRSIAACWSVCSVSGSGLASAVERLEEGLRAEQDRRRAVEAELAGPRATAVMLAVLPLAGMLLATGLGADPVGVLLHTPLGLACLAGGLLLDGLGLWWTSRLVVRAGGAA